MIALLLACTPGSPTIDASDSDPKGDPTEDSPTIVPDDTDTTATILPWTGSGADGELSVDADMEATQIGASLFRVTAVDGALVTVDHDVSGLAEGDEVLFYVTQGTRDRYEDAGVYLFATVVGISGAEVELSEAPPIGPLDAQSAIVQRVPHFTDVDINAELSPPAYDGVAGGVLALRATGTVRVNAGGSIRGDGKGYAGGSAGTSVDADGYQGTSYTGIGLGGRVGDPYNEANDAWENNGGGGGSCVTGAGGEHAGGATDGTAWHGDTETPLAGETYGEADLSRFYFGSGGGGIWSESAEPAFGGNGGGILFVAARTVVVSAAEGITARGDDTVASSSGNFTYGAGGGAGGTIWLVANTLDLAEGSLIASGGLGMSDVEKRGGDGGEGRIRLDYNESAGATPNQAAEPDPGYTEAP